MDALGSLRLAATPQLPKGALPKDLQDTLAKSIPAAELEKLGAGRFGNGSIGKAVPGSDSIAGTESGGGSFESTLNQFVEGVSRKQAVGNDAISGLLSGQNGSLHQTMIAMEEASVSFQLMVEVRNKLLESYQELMRMQV
jgi:flagellar hook-basal body complex protein FliE